MICSRVRLIRTRLSRVSLSKLSREIGLSELTENAHQWFNKPILLFYQQVSNSWR